MSDASAGDTSGTNSGFSWFGQGGDTGDDDALEGVQPPSQKVVDLFHGKASTTEPTDLHHRIGFGPGDVADGQHTHDGTDSYALFASSALPQPVAATPTNAQLASALNTVIAALNTKASQS